MPENEIIRLIEKIRERYDRIYGPSGKVITIEADLMLADIRHLYEKLSSPSLADTPPVAYEIPLEEEIIEPDKEPVQSEAVAKPIPSPPANLKMENTDKPVFEFVPSPMEAFSEPIADLITEDETADEIHPPAQPPALPQPAISKQSFGHEEHRGKSISEIQGLDLFGTPLPIMADKLGEEKWSVNEKLNAETIAEKSIGSKLRQPVTDLKTAIGINDRFHFINELFEGDMRVYDEVLTNLNTSASLQDAISIFESIKITRGWTADLESVSKLLDFIHRRFA